MRHNHNDPAANGNTQEELMVFLVVFRYLFLMISCFCFSVIRLFFFPFLVVFFRY